jgi:hypothetical protein
MLILVEKGILRPISGLPNRLFAGCLQVKFRFGEHCNAIFKPENNPQTLPDSCLPNAASISLCFSFLGVENDKSISTARACCYFWAYDKITCELLIGSC